jgi:hypothetical protein
MEIGNWLVVGVLVVMVVLLARDDLRRLWRRVKSRARP